ncbi:MAG: hypothetical protein K6G69_03235 [Lachnospiraceae bacterium]|nr:hypothetical protein [Lachnospiraceae bacterium]
MLPEDKYIKEQFEKRFLKDSTNNIVIYGIGERTENLLKNISGDRIVGLMDAKHTGEILYGKRVLNYDEVSEISDVIIVIIARNSVINIIYKRIESFVNQHMIKVYDINGTEIVTHSLSGVERECFSIQESDLWGSIDQADIVSFDIFDTLLARRVMRPVDVFRIVEDSIQSKDYSYAQERIRAEKELSFLVSPTIYEIYKRLGENIGLDKVETDKILRTEIDVEKKALARRDSVCRLLSRAKRLGKKVLLISDMYFTKDIIEEILKFFDIVDYDEIYVSCEYHETKSSGLYDIVRKKENVTGNWLHIGDNDYSDIQKPKSLGISTYKIFSSTEMLEQSIYADILEYNASVETSVILGQFAAVAYNNPFGGFDKTGKLIIDSAEELAKTIFAPIIFKFIEWLVIKVKEDGIDFIMFPSRDGFILKDLYEYANRILECKDTPNDAYVYTSRRAALVSAVKDVEGIKKVAEFPGSLSIEERAKKRFEISDDVKYMSDEFVDEALKRSAREKKEYLDYFKKMNLENYDNISFVDFVSIGTVQEALEKLLQRHLQGYYFLRRYPDNEYKKHMDIDALYGTYNDFEMNMNLYKYYYFMEMLLSSYEACFKYIDEDGKLRFYEENRSEESIQILKELHRGLYSYCEEVIPLIMVNTKWSDTVELYDHIIGFFSNDYINIKNGLINDFINVDEFMERKVSESNR